MVARAVFLLLLIGSAGFAPGQNAAPLGIPRALAEHRASIIRDVHYRLHFTLNAGSATIAGNEELRFSLASDAAASPAASSSAAATNAAAANAPATNEAATNAAATSEDLLLDYRDGVAQSLNVNGSAASPAQTNGHLLLSARLLHAGENTIQVAFTSNVAPAGKPFIRYNDRDDGAEYIYTLFVPMDASMAFPCFDQPDIKGRFTLDVLAPQTWKVVSNTASTSGGLYVFAHGLAGWFFPETQPISTYLFAFAAGPFKKIESPGLPTLWVRQSKLARAQPEAPDVQRTAQDGINYLSQYFAQPFPFPKYEMVLIPGMAYGGMEHAGATFLREESVLFRTAPTRTDLLQRQVLVLHELTHQWFGDFTTMRWFDDLWLKEGFAQYMAYATLAALHPDQSWPIWKQFYLSIKPAAYAIDSTKGTTPIYQDIPNLLDAKSAYGAIVYNKAPGVLKQLAYVVGDEHFRDGLRLYLKEHAYANAEWSDLVGALERTSGQKLDRWADMWIRHRGMPQVDVQWSCSAGAVSSLTLAQHDVLGEGSVWPIATSILLHYADGNIRRVRAQFSSPQFAVAEARGLPCPEFVFANDLDYAYGRFLLDIESQSAVLPKLGETEHLRPLLWGSLWDSVRVARLEPKAFIALAQKLLPAETDESLAQFVIARTATALHRYVPTETRTALAPALEAAALDRMQHSDQPGLRIIWFRALRNFAETGAGRGSLKQILAGRLAVPGVELRPLDRWNIITSLVAFADPDADALLAAEREHDHSGDAAKYAYVAEAARPTAATKKTYFDDYLNNPSRPEDWVEQSLGAFNFWNQPALTAPYLEPALSALPEVKRTRKIFFLVAWLDAFIGGQRSSESDVAVHRFLAASHPDRDLELKILQVVDELDRTVAIRAAFP